MKDTDHKLKERVKELKCLYEISKVALEANNDVDALVAKTLQIIPAAMQFPEIAETEIQIGSSKFSTRHFAKCKLVIKARLNINKKTAGSIKIGYLKSGNGSTKVTYQPEAAGDYYL